MNHLRMAIGVGVLLTAGCELADIGTEVKYVGPFQTARPFDCRMQMIFGPLPYPHQDIARARTECPDHVDDEEMCFDSIRQKACLVGADTVYGIAETRGGGLSYLNSTFARILPGPIGRAAAGPPAAQLACDPICSPGFACAKGTCVPQCNPTCAADEICTPQRACVPTHRMSKSPQPEGRRQIATVISWDHQRATHEAANDVAVGVAEKPGTRADGASDGQADRSGIDPIRTAPERSAADGVLRGTSGAHVLRAGHGLD
jgi:hypothetical protein